MENKELLDEALDAVDKLNEYIDSILGVETPHFFSMSSDNYVVSLFFNDELLWTSSDDIREYIPEKDDYEPLIDFVKKEYNKYVKDLYKLKFI